MKAAEYAAIFSAKWIQPRKKVRHDSLFFFDSQPTRRARATFSGEGAMEALVRTLCSVSSSVAKAGNNIMWKLLPQGRFPVRVNNGTQYGRANGRAENGGTWQLSVGKTFQDFMVCSRLVLKSLHRFASLGSTRRVSSLSALAARRISSVQNLSNSV
ncbi:hypothetical protein BC826DRAFT_80760 [Russula brevipes]|nr:hypothetical protein BC826DRAFT_80760 [Russula brevipes]